MSNWTPKFKEMDQVRVVGSNLPDWFLWYVNGVESTPEENDYVQEILYSLDLLSPAMELNAFNINRLQVYATALESIMVLIYRPGVK